MKKACVVVGALLAAVVGVRSQNLEPKQRYHDLGRRIYFNDPNRPDSKVFKFPPREDMEKTITELRDMVRATILNDLSDPNVTSKSLRGSILDLQGDQSPSFHEPLQKAPFVDFSSVSGVKTLMVAFGIMAGGFAIPDVHVYIQFYSQEAGVWKLKGETASEFRGCMFAVRPLRSGVTNQVWYLASGKAIGDTGARLNLRLYGFDGTSVSTTWQRDGLVHGDVSVSADGSQVSLRYDEHVPGPIALRFRHVEEVLRPSFNGMIRESLSETLDK